MSGPTDRRADGSHREELERSRRRWDFWSAHYDLNERDTEPMRRAAVETLGLARGDAVLDVGCGPGVNFEMLREAVGPTGRVVGVDYSPNMVERARERVADHGWGNVEVRRADATRASFDTAFDAALATHALTATPDVTAAVERVHDALRPGGRFAVLGLRPVPDGPARVLNPLIRLALRAVGNWNAEQDALAALHGTFERVEVTGTYALGTNYVAVATRSTDD